jgi:hypothetical protein
MPVTVRCGRTSRRSIGGFVNFSIASYLIFRGRFDNGIVLFVGFLYFFLNYLYYKIHTTPHEGEIYF